MSSRWLVVVLGAASVTSGCSESSRPTGPGGGGTPVVLRLISISPATGLPTASTPIQISGTGFVDGATLTLDGAAMSVTFVSSALLRATAPPHPAGPIDVAVRNPNDATAELKGAFRYEVPITSLTIGGNTSLQSVGHTTQLTATAVYADGSTQDVTSAAPHATSPMTLRRIEDRTAAAVAPSARYTPISRRRCATSYATRP